MEILKSENSKTLKIKLLGLAALMPNLRAQLTYPEARFWNTEAQRADASAKKKKHRDFAQAPRFLRSFVGRQSG